MAHNEDYAKRLLRELPDDPAVLLKRWKTYADPTFLGLFIPHLDGLIFDDPQSVLKWAKIMPDLALLVEEETGPDGRRKHRNRLVKAWSLSGGAQLSCGQYQGADQAFSQALKIIDSEAIAPLLHSQVAVSCAYLRACQRRFDEALELAISSVSLVPENEKEAMVLAIICRGYALASLRRFAEAIRDFGDALNIIDPKQSPAAERMHLAAVSNMAYVVSSSLHYFDQFTAREYVLKARELVKGGRRFVPRYRLLWLEGLICMRLENYKRARKAFQIALEGFEALNLPFEIALVALDLGQLHAFLGEWDKLEPLARATFKRFRVLAADTGTIAALSQWTDAVKARTLEDEITAKARRLVEARVGSRTRKKGSLIVVKG